MMKIWYCQYDVHGVCEDALDWSEEPLEQKNLTLFYTSLAFIWVFVDICRCNGFTVLSSTPDNSVSLWAFFSIVYLFRWCDIKSQYLCIFTVRHFQNVVCAIKYICSTKYIKEANASFIFYITVWLFLLKAQKAPCWHVSPINPSADIKVKKTPSRDASDEDGSKPEVPISGMFQTTSVSYSQEKGQTNSSLYSLCYFWLCR